MKSATLTVEGLHCQGCVQTVKSLVGGLPGVRGVEVSLEQKEARVLYDPNAVSEDDVVAAIERPGYRVTARNP